MASHRSRSGIVFCASSICARDGQREPAPRDGFPRLAIRKDLVDSGRYKKTSDLKGLKVAIAAPGTVPDYTLGMWARKGGLKLSDINLSVIPRLMPSRRSPTNPWTEPLSGSR